MVGLANDYLLTGAVCQKQKVEGIRYEARSCGRSSPDTLAFLSLRNAQMIESLYWTKLQRPSKGLK